MHEHAPILTAHHRSRLGTRYARRLRQQGRLPAIVYGHGLEPTPVTLDAHDALHHIHRGEKVFRLQLDGQTSLQVVLLKAVQFDYLGTHVVHVDLARVDLDERVHTRVPLHLVGDARGLHTAGAILMHPLDEIEIECRVADLPESIDVDVTELDVGHAITAGDVRLPLPSMRLLTDPTALVAQIVIQARAKTEEELTVEATAQPEVITEKKKEAEGAEGG